MKNLLIDQLVNLYKQLLKIIMEAETNQTEASKKLFEGAVAALGKNWCKNHELGCAETVNNIYRNVFGKSIGGGASTYLMHMALKGPSFLQVKDPLPGDVVISPTGFGNKTIPNGHVGIVGEGEYIMSNDSATGLFKKNFTFDSWDARYKDRGAYPILFFRPL